MAVVSILIGGLITLINPATQLRRGRDATRKSDLSQIRAALELLRSDHGCYQNTTCTLAGFPPCGSALTVTVGPTTYTYMTRIPCDPQGGSYSYDAPSASNYCIRACLENTTDPQRDPTNNPTIPGCTLVTCAAGRWSITLQNP